MSSVQPIASVIIPVYNKACYLKSCMNSLEAQSIDPALFEILFIDDGSTDGSLAICRGFENAFGNVRVIHQENQGVSSARNTGIDQALGRYILFVDADDILSSNAIAEIINSAEAFGDETDVIAFRIVYYNPETGKRTYHKRETWLKDRDVYRLDEYPYIVQSTMNVCIRNRGCENVHFDPNLKMGEDQLFVTQSLLRKGTIGYCPSAEYVYTCDGTNASRPGNLPYFAFNDMMALYGSLIYYARENSSISSYLYQLILYNFDWRIRCTMLFPSSIGYLGSIEQDDQLIALMKQIPAREYCSSPYLDEYHKGYLLRQIGALGKETMISHSQDSTNATMADGYSWSTLPVRVIFSSFQVRNGMIEALGRLMCPTFIVEDKPSLTIEFQNEVTDVALSASSFDYHHSKSPLTKCWNFSIELACPLKTTSSMCLCIRISDKPVPGFNIELSPKMHDARVVAGTMYFKDVKVKPCGTAIQVASRSKKDTLNLVRNSMCDRRTLARRLAVKAFGRRLKGRRVWMYADNPRVCHADNALYQFVADIERNDGVDRYYISNFEKDLLSEYPQIKGRVVSCGSREHAYLSILSEVVLASYLEEFAYFPMKSATYNTIGDLSLVKLRVYLQHGVLHAHMPWYFSYDRLIFDKEVISTSFERLNLTGQYGFPPRALIDSGAPSFDRIEPASATGKRILYAPSWRKYLVSGGVKQRHGNEDKFKKSSFYRGVTFLTELISISGILDREDTVFEIKLHPNFECYRHLFKSDNPRIVLAPDTIDVNDYALMITDFSSYVYDFVYAGASIIYFVPDALEFAIGLNHYWELDLKYEDRFGPYCTDAHAVVAEIDKVLSNSGCLADECDRNDRAKQFFLHNDGRNSERLYRFICDYLNCGETE